MRYLARFIPHVVVLAVLATFLHYTLPQKDIARIIDAYERRVDFGLTSVFFWAQSPAGTANLETRDVFFIDAAMPDGSLMVYRNEDTGFGWPPYFKVDSANLNAEAKTLASKEEDPVWVAITHYGWRSEFLTIYPNAVSIARVEGPDASTFPWFSLVLLTVFAVLILILYRVTRRFYNRRIAPVLERLGRMFRPVVAKVGSLWRFLVSSLRRSGK